MSFVILGLHRFSLGQISELLRLTKESYCNVKLKCPDTGQHTVVLFNSYDVSIYSRIYSESLLLLNLKCFVYIFLNCMGSCQS